MWDDVQKTAEFLIGQPSPWRWPRIIIGGAVLILAGVVWKCSEVVEPDEQAMRMIFGRVKFRYFDSGEGSYWDRLKERRVNRKAVRDLRKGPDANKPHLQLQYGKPVIYGPGRYTKVPGALSFRKQKVQPENIDTEAFIQYENQFRAVTIPIQIVVRLADIFLWEFASNDTNGTLTGIAGKIYRIIKDDLGAEQFVDDSNKVEEEFRRIAKEEFAFYGAEVAALNIQLPVTSTEGWMPTAIAAKDFVAGVGLAPASPT